MVRTQELRSLCLWSCLWLAGCSADADKVSGTGGSNEPSSDPGAPADPTPATPGQPGGEQAGEQNGDTGRCGAGCEEVKVGTDGAGFDLDAHPHTGVAVDVDGSLILADGTAQASASIWIANTAEQTVSKIDTSSLKELARYRVGAADPSRTSVAATGDAYVGSRDGQGLTKISAQGSKCPDSNGDGVITTSSGASDVLAFGQDDCVLWFTSLSDSIRGVAAQDIPASTKVTRTPGKEPTIETSPARHYVWAGGGTLGKLFKLDGDTGAVLLTTSAPRGIYGLALDGSGLLWMTGGAYWGGALGVVDTRSCVSDASCDVPVCAVTCSETLCPDSCDGAVKANITLSPESAYGITVDCKQRVWLGGSGGPIKRYDPTAARDQRLTVAPESAHTSGVHGIAADAKGWIWGAVSGQGVVRLDAETLTQSTLIRTDYGAKGIAVAANGDVWAVTQSSMAHVIKPGPLLSDNLLTASAVSGLVSPYTYSDMTGEQLRLATNEPGHYRRSFAGCAGQATRWRDLAFDIDAPAGTTVIVRARGADSEAALASAAPVLLAVLPEQTSPVALAQTSLAEASYLELELELIVEGGSSAGRCDGERTTPRVRQLSVERVCVPPVL